MTHKNSLTQLGLRLAATRKAIACWSFLAFGDIFKEVRADEEAYQGRRRLLTDSMTRLSEKFARC